ncbi:MAG: 4-(cytidine 5'-diphospho)-2-C-methyl-D-erythritol kinase [Bacteroidales bacterium]|nr:MAG: 4-(cytidine 5'-diphospho)-2-C-methyl-D-erythritol kinase [Bacteroidales bacterium]
MIVFPNAKVNLGLNIVARRDDGFHNIETIFFPVNGLCDILEIVPFPEQKIPVVFTQTGLTLNEPDEKNLCVKAYHLLSTSIELPPVAIHLHKQIPFGAGLGGGSSDGAQTLVALNKLSDSPLSQEKLMEVALKLGSDCPFFIKNTPCYATGRGEELTTIDLNLKEFHILLINPGLHINTGKAYSFSSPMPPVHKLTNSIKKELTEWRNLIFNDFEKVVFDLYPEIGLIKDELYEMGAIYSAMSGSGSTVFGIFKERPSYDLQFSDYFTFYQKI